MARVANTYRALNRQILPVGVRTFLFDTRRAEDASIQYQVHTAGGSTTAKVYGTTEQDTSRLFNASGVVIDPLTLGDLWFELPTQFATDPITGVGTEVLPIANEPHTFVAISFTTTVQMPSISLLFTAKTE